MGAAEQKFVLLEGEQGQGYRVVVRETNSGGAVVGGPYDARWNEYLRQQTVLMRIPSSLNKRHAAQRARDRFRRDVAGLLEGW